VKTLFALLIPWALLPPAPVAAQVAEPAEITEALTLADAVTIALAHNPRLAAADAGRDRATAQLDEARAGRLPRVELTEGAFATTNPTLVFSAKLGQEAFSQSDFDPDLLNHPDSLTNFSTRLTVTQPLWTGGRLAGAIGAASFGAEAATASRERVRQVVIFQVIDAYTGVIAADRGLEAVREALATARSYAELVGDLRAGGLVVESDLLAAEVRVAELEEGVVLAESAAAVARAGLNLALGLPQETVHRLDPALATTGTEAEDLEALLETAQAGRPDLAAVEAGLRAAGEQVRSARAGRMPELGLSGSWEANAKDFIGADGSNWTVSLGFKWTAFDGFGHRARLRQAEASLAEAEQLARLAREGAGLEVRQAFYALTAAGKRLALTARAVGQARRSLEIVRDRYQEGLAPAIEVLEAETTLTDARSRQVAAQRDQLKARAALDLAVGRL